MAELALVMVGILGLLVFLLFGALIEMHRDVRQMRDAIGILDRPLPIDIGDVVDTRPSKYGLPATLDRSASALVLFLSDSCATCRVLASSLNGNVPPGVYILLLAKSSQSGAAFLASYNLTPDTTEENLFIDSAHQIAKRIGLDTTPAAFRVENGYFVSATTVPSARYLVSILPKSIRLKSQPIEQRRYA